MRHVVLNENIKHIMQVDVDNDNARWVMNIEEKLSFEDRQKQINRMMYAKKFIIKTALNLNFKI